MLVSEIGMKGGNGTERTEVDTVPLKILELLPIDYERGDVASVVALVNTDGDVGSPFDNTEPAAVGILPVGGDVGEQGLESIVVLVLVLQSVIPASQSRRILLGRDLEFFGKSGGVTEPSGDSVLDLADGTSETTITTNEDVLRVGLVELVVGGGVEGGNVFISEAEDPVAGLATARLHLLEQEREGALRVVGLPGDGDAKAGVERMIVAKLAAGVVHDAHKRRADQTGDRALVPLDNDIGDLDIREDVEDVWRGITNGLGVGGVGANGNPDNDGAESFALITVLDGREASRLKRGVLEAVGFHRRQDLRSDGFPHGVERRVEDAVGSLSGDLEEIRSRWANGEGVGFEIRTVHELGRVAGEAVVIEVHLVGGDQVGGDDGVSVRVVAELRGSRGGRRGRRLSSVLWRSLDGGLAPETVDHEAGHA
jgi:hypothetical protein